MKDIEIAQQAPIRPIEEIARRAGIGEKYLETYGKTKAKVDHCLLHEKPGSDGKLVLVSAINPTAAGEGKTTTTVGLADALRVLGKNAIVALREPSLGPMFGMKGGAAGGGRAQVIPMEDINLHFTGDFHAVGAANNLLAAMIDNHIYHGNALGIHPERITWKRCVDMNDRQLRGGFNITAASEIMAILCLAADIGDLKRRIANIIVGYTYDDRPVRAADLGAHGALTALMKDALKPNLVQTLEGTPAFIHGGPFANIAHGCNSLMATRMALRLGEYAITEAGFGADLGAQKFFDIKCRVAGLRPDAVVLVATARALKLHGGADKKTLDVEDLQALERGLPNLLRHVDNIKNVYRVPAVVAINRFPSDTPAELSLIETKCREKGIRAVLSEVWEKGGVTLAQEVVRLCDEPSDFRFCYEDELPILGKIRTVARKIYRADDIIVSPEAHEQAQRLEALGYGTLPVCLAKTQFSFSDNPALRGAPEGFTINVRSLQVLAGAGFIVAATGDIMTMPGLPKVPAVEKIDVDEHGKISDFFSHQGEIMTERILVLDFGGQYKELIAGTVRSLGVYSEIMPGDTPASEIRRLNPVGIILTGGPNSIYLHDSPKCDPEIFTLGIPILGICYGMQMMCHMLGGEVTSAGAGEYGRVTVAPTTVSSELFRVEEKPFAALMSHRDVVSRLPAGFYVTASTAGCVAACEDAGRKLYGVQFHPEAKHTEGGREMIRRFLYAVCGAAGDYKLDDYIDTQIAQVRARTRDRGVLLALSGGVDSSVCASLLSRAIPGRLTCIFVDHGFMRLNEGDEIERIFSRRKLRFIRVNAQKRFLAKVKGTADPETKRKLIGEEFIRVFEEESAKLGDIPFLAQGTIYSDIVESGGGHGATIKSHHNVGGLPENLTFREVIEPLAGLFKDEVRVLGRKLGLPAMLVNRQPFPGPGLAIRVMGEVTEKKLEILRHADAILREELDGMKRRPDQYFTVLTDTRSVGVKGDDRTYEPVIAVRAVTTGDFMTCDYAALPHKILSRISSRVTSEIPLVSRVVYDITSKPPATVEWE